MRRFAVVLVLALVACTQEAGGNGVTPPGGGPQSGLTTPVPPKNPIATATPAPGAVGASLAKLEVTIDGVPVNIVNAGAFVVTGTTARWTIGREGGTGWFVDLGVVFGRTPSVAGIQTADAKTVSLAINRVGGSGGWLATRNKGDDDLKINVVDNVVTVEFDGTMSDPSSGRTAAVKAVVSGRLPS